jgi:diguanylate cyclase (GGDEF)-like protein/PAS domain S-box-containing protein
VNAESDAGIGTPALLDSVLHAVRVGMIVLDESERVVMWNRWMEEHSSYPASSVLGKRFVELFPELTNGRAHGAIRGALQSKLASLISQTLNKAPFPLYATAEDRLAGVRIQQAVQVVPLDHPGSAHCLVQISDVSMAVAREKQLRELAMELQGQIFIDGLTGIPNRRRFDEHVENEFRRAKRSGSPLSLAMIDVDAFKDYNDNYGHQKGDDCLILIAAALTRILGRPCDLVARYGGEEFVALMPDTNADGALQLAESMRREVESLAVEHAFSGVAPHVTISVGLLTQVPSHNTVISHMIGAADRALYQAKRGGRNCVVVHGVAEKPEQSAG